MSDSNDEKLPNEKTTLFSGMGKNIPDVGAFFFAFVLAKLLFTVLVVNHAVLRNYVSTTVVLNIIWLITFAVFLLLFFTAGKINREILTVSNKMVKWSVFLFVNIAFPLSIFWLVMKFLGYLISIIHSS